MKLENNLRNTSLRKNVKSEMEWKIRNWVVGMRGDLQAENTAFMREGLGIVGKLHKGHCNWGFGSWKAEQGAD